MLKINFQYHVNTARHVLCTREISPGKKIQASFLSSMHRNQMSGAYGPSGARASYVRRVVQRVGYELESPVSGDGVVCASALPERRWRGQRNGDDGGVGDA